MSDPFDRAVMRGELEKHAARIQRERDALFIHITVIGAVNVMLFVIWLLTWTGFPWFLFPLMGTGVGVAAHVAVYRTRANGLRRAEEQLALPPGW